jgi:chromosome segregation ATPase
MNTLDEVQGPVDGQKPDVNKFGDQLKNMNKMMLDMQDRLKALEEELSDKNEKLIDLDRKKSDVEYVDKKVDGVNGSITKLSKDLREEAAKKVVPVSKGDAEKWNKAVEDLENISSNLGSMRTSLSKNTLDIEKLWGAHRESESKQGQLAKGKELTDLSERVKQLEAFKTVAVPTLETHRLDIEELKKRLQEVEYTMATSEDLKRTEGRIESLEIHTHKNIKAITNIEKMLKSMGGMDKGALSQLSDELEKLRR